MDLKIKAKKIIRENLSATANILTYKERIAFHKMAEDVAKGYLNLLKNKSSKTQAVKKTVK